MEFNSIVGSRSGKEDSKVRHNQRTLSFLPIYFIVLIDA